MGFDLITFARHHDLEIAVRGGCHSPAGWATTHGLLIDLSGLKQIDIDPARRLARLEAGVLGGAVVSEARRCDLAQVFQLWATSGNRGRAAGFTERVLR